MNTREVANAANVAWETLRGYMYRGKLPSVETLYYIATGIKKPIRIPGPNGTLVLQLEEETRPCNGVVLAAITPTKSLRGSTKSRLKRRRRSSSIYGDGPYRHQETATGESRGTHGKKPRNLGRLSGYDLIFFVAAVLVPAASLVIALAWMTNERW